MIRTLNIGKIMQLYDPAEILLCQEVIVVCSKKSRMRLCFAVLRPDSQDHQDEVSRNASLLILDPVRRYCSKNISSGAPLHLES